MLRRYRLGRDPTRRRIKVFVSYLSKQIEFSYNSEALLQTCGGHCSPQRSFETFAGHEGGSFLATCPTNRWAAFSVPRGDFFETVILPRVLSWFRVLCRVQYLRLSH